MKEMVGGCCVCSDDRGWTENPLVYCDGQGCTVAVHQACYGIVTVPTGNWYCRKCESQERTARVKCELCPCKDGALKRTDTNGWAHVVCALYIPEVRFGNVTTMEPILIQHIPQERFSKSCYICDEAGKGGRSSVGACMQCNKSGCKQQFHVTCAQALGLLCEEAGNYLDNVKYCGYCQHHYSKLKKTGNVKTIPPYRSVSADASNSSPEKEPNENWGKSTGRRKVSSSGKPPPPVMKSMHIAPMPGSFDTTSSQGDDSNSNSQTKDSPVSTHSNSGKGENSSGGGGKFTTSNFVESVVTPSESVFGDVSKSSSKKRKKDDLPGGDDAKKAKTDNSSQENIQPPSVVVKLPIVPNSGTGGNSPSAVITNRITSTSSSSPSHNSVPASGSNNAITTTTALVNTPSVSIATVAPTVVTQTNATANSSNPDESPNKRSRSQSSEKSSDRSGRNKKRGGGGSSSSNSSSSKRSSRSNQSTPPPPPVPSTPSTSTVSVAASVTTSVVTAPTPVTTTTSSTFAPQPTDSPASSTVVKIESPPSSPEGSSKRSCNRNRKSIKEENKDIKPDMKLLQNGIMSTPPHMLGNQLNLSSSMVQSMSDSFNKELEGDDAITTDTSQPTNNLIGPQLHSRVIASVRSSNANTCAPTTTSSTVTTASSMGWGGALGTVPQTLEQLLERQWEQGSQFLMEQAQHFDIASLLSCLHQLRAENLRLEEHVNSLVQRRDHLLAVNARLAIPLTQGSASVSVPQTTNQVHPDVTRGGSQRVNNSYPLHPIENGLPPSPPTTTSAYRASPAQPSPNNISRHHSPSTQSYVSSTPGVVVPRGGINNESHRSDSRRTNQASVPNVSGPGHPQSSAYSAMYQQQQQQQMVIRRDVGGGGDIHNQLPPASKPS